MKFISFTSGSCGNCCYLGDPDTKQGLLIDAGASMRRVKKILLENSLGLDNFGAILITHDHLDHIRFLGTFCKYLSPKVCTTAKLHKSLSNHIFTRDHISSCRVILEKEKWNEVNGFEVRFFEVPHDATQTVGYAVKYGKGHLFVLMTDLEHVTQEAISLAREADTVVIESNYDRQMLLSGPYPPQLQQRILDEGHLSNAACGEAIKKIWHPGLRNLFLCHLSGNNNTPQLAYDNAREALRCAGIDPGEVNLRVLPRGESSPLITL